jgi:hypothetical protein
MPNKKSSRGRADSAQDASYGGRVSKGAERAPIADLRERMARRFERRRERFIDMSRRFEAMQAPLFAPLAKDAGVAKQVRELREKLKRAGRPPLSVERYPGEVEPGIRSGSILTIKVPPYDVPFTDKIGSPADVAADVGAGTFSVGVSGGGGNTSALAGVGVWFRSLTDNVNTRVAALTDYSFNWFDISSGGYVAHNNGSINIWVWGDSEQNWVSRQTETPSWSDGTGWYEEHSDADDGRVSNQSFFPARPNAWYLAVMWASSSVHDNDGGLFGFSWAQADLAASVPIVVFEQ